MFSSLALALPALKLPPFLVPYLGAQSPLRFWAYALIAFALMSFFRGSRRWGGFGFLGTAACLLIYLGLNSMIASVTPK